MKDFLIQPEGYDCVAIFLHGKEFRLVAVGSRLHVYAPDDYEAQMTDTCVKFRKRLANESPSESDTQANG